MVRCSRSLSRIRDSSSLPNCALSMDSSDCIDANCSRSHSLVTDACKLFASVPWHTSRSRIWSRRKSLPWPSASRDCSCELRPIRNRSTFATYFMKKWQFRHLDAAKNWREKRTKRGQRRQDRHGRYEEGVRGLPKHRVGYRVGSLYTTIIALFCFGTNSLLRMATISECHGEYSRPNEGGIEMWV